MVKLINPIKEMKTRPFFMKSFMMLGVVAIGLASANVYAGDDYDDYDDDYYYGDRMMRGHPGRRLETMDTNNDRIVSRSEFDAVHDETFKLIDSNNDGNLSLSEIRAHRDRLRRDYDYRRKHFFRN